MITKMKTLYKFLRTGLKSDNGDSKDWEVGAWRKEDNIKICEQGFHASKTPLQALGYVKGEILAKVSVRGESVKDEDKECWSEMRVDKAWNWTKEDSVKLAVFASEQVLGIYEKQYPNDDRPRKAIEAAKAWLKNPTEETADAAKARATFTTTSRAAELATSQFQNLAAAGNLERAATVKAFGEKMAGTAADLADTLPDMEKAAQATSATAQKMAGSAQTSQKILDALQAAREARAIPAQVVSSTANALGDGLIALDRGLSSSLKRLGDYGSIVGLSEGRLLPAAVRTAISSGPLLKGIANTSKILGDELIQARGTIPYWQRVAENSTASPLLRATSHLIDTATLGGKNPILKLASGTASALPVATGLQVLSDGGELSPSTFNKALANAFVFGGTGAVAGALVQGSLKAKQFQMAGDEINFRRNLHDQQIPLFDQLPPGTRRVMSAYQAAFPDLNFELKPDGASFHDPNLNKVSINVNSNRILEPMLAHEVQHYLSVRAGMEDGIVSSLIGDPTTGHGGFLRAKDGTLDPNFQAFIDKYNAAGAADGIAPLTPQRAAIEYFTEAVTDDLKGMASSGELSARAARSSGERVVRNLASRMVGRDVILKDMFYKLGGATNAQGSMVPGNGILADGIRELPGAKQIVRQMLNEFGGRRMRSKASASSPTGEITQKPTLQKPVKVELDTSSPAVQDSLAGSVFQTDEQGNVIRDENGNAKPITEDQDKAKADAGKEALRVIKEKVDGGDPIEMNPSGKKDEDFTGTLPDEAIDAMRDTKAFSPQEVGKMRMLNDAIRAKSGETFLVSYKPTWDTKGKTKIFNPNRPVELREVIPIAQTVTKGGNVLTHMMDVQQLSENVKALAHTTKGQKLYGSNILKIMEDVHNSTEIQSKGDRTDSYYQQKYGDNWKAHKDFINTVFGFHTKDQAIINPTFIDQGMHRSYESGVYKTFKAHEIRSATRLQGRAPIFYGYEPVKNNWLPNGVPEFPQDNATR